MISFRFHLVSLVAVFLALGLGVLTGTTVLNRGIVAILEGQTDDLRERTAELRGRVDQLEAESRMWTSFGDRVMDYMVAGELPGTDVILITQEGTDGSGIEGARRALDEAGAELRAVLSVNRRMSLEQDADRQALSSVLGVGGEDPAALQTRAAEAVALRLSLGAGTQDLLARLLESGFLVNQGPGIDGDGLRQLGGNGEVFVVVAGGVGPPTVDPSAFLVPLVRRLALEGEAVAAAESLTSEYAFVGLLRGDDAVANSIVTQDNVDRIPGGVGLVLALRELVTDGAPGHYGVKDGAAGPIPPPSGA